MLQGIFSGTFEKNERIFLNGSQIHYPQNSVTRRAESIGRKAIGKNTTQLVFQIDKTDNI